MKFPTTTLAQRLGALLLSIAAIAIAGSTAPATAVSATAGCRNADVLPAHLSNHQARRAIVCLINQKREGHGLIALGHDSRLQKAAQRHDELMRTARCFAHQCPGEHPLVERLRDVQYLNTELAHWVCGEVLAWGLYEYATPHAIVRGWMHSPPHREAILHAGFREIGVGVVRGTPDEPHGLGATFATDFGLRIG
jgi:uncharacterized protein YkwD